MKLLISDLEGTLVSHPSSWQELNRLMGITEERNNELYTAHGNGKIMYEEWSDLLVREWIRNNQFNGKLKRDFFIDFFNNIYSCVDYARIFVQKVKEKGYYFYVASNSIDLLIEKAKNDLGFDDYYPGDSLIFDSKDILCGISCSGMGFKKEKVLEAFKRKYNISHSVGIGDFDNDISMLKSVDVGILVNPSELIKKRGLLDEVKDAGIIIVDNLRQALKHIE